jgi:uncharacterized protein YndB with AHSA1/START domain
MAGAHRSRVHLALLEHDVRHRLACRLENRLAQPRRDDRRPEQVVLESEPPRRLSYTWHTFTPELATRFGWEEERLALLAAEPRSQVTFELEPDDGLTKLTVIHDGFEPGSAVLESISGGWPRVIANLKTLLETGETLAV